MLKLLTGALALSLSTLPPAHAESARPIKVLIVSGGCCHIRHRGSCSKER